MRKLIFTNILLLILVLAYSCFSDEIEKHIVGKYYLVGTDDIRNTVLGFKDSDELYGTIVDRTVFSSGHNNGYIYVKQYPNTDKTYYYIIPIENEINYNRIKKYGPYTLLEFEMKCRELGIKDIDFSINIEL